MPAYSLDHVHHQVRKVSPRPADRATPSWTERGSHTLSSSAAGGSDPFGWVWSRLSRASAAHCGRPEPTRMRPQVRPREVRMQPAVLIGPEQPTSPLRWARRPVSYALRAARVSSIKCSPHVAGAADVWRRPRSPQSVGCSLGCSHPQLGKPADPLSGGVHRRPGGCPFVWPHKERPRLRGVEARKAAFDQAEAAEQHLYEHPASKGNTAPHDANSRRLRRGPIRARRRYPGTGIPGRLVRPSASAASSNSISGRRSARKSS